ncbi:MAG: hypothetical protein JW762_10830 [Dehalococcoidales bacterium]|nr:hypothetical protein [Dehalococcoidales bacterium]
MTDERAGTTISFPSVIASFRVYSGTVAIYINRYRSSFDKLRMNGRNQMILGEDSFHQRWTSFLRMTQHSIFRIKTEVGCHCEVHRPSA